LRRAGAVVLLCAGTAAGLPAQSYSVLGSFNGTNGAGPEFGTLVQDAAGNFYGTTTAGGANFAGSVFQVTPDGTVTALYSFCSVRGTGEGCTDGSNPLGGVVLATDGNFYGMTPGGGPTNAGTIYKLTPGGTLTTLHTFDGTDGQIPDSTLIQASDGNLYGTTVQGLVNSAGLAFRITLGGAMTVLHNFCAQVGCTDGAEPSGLVQGTDGNFYGAAQTGGANNLNDGTIFKLTSSGALTTVYSFCLQAGCPDGGGPTTALIQGTDGNFYGATAGGGGAVNYETIYKVTPGGTLTTLYNFCSQACLVDPVPSALMQASDGNFYGTTRMGGANGQGTIFRITPKGTFTTLYNFCADENCVDGASPSAGLMQAPNGNLYGTTNSGGAYGQGAVFSLALSSAASVPVIKQGGIGSGASFLPGVAGGSWITIVGTNLSPVMDTWANAIVNGDLPTVLDGVSVSVGGQAAYVDYISPTQINIVAPDVGTGNVAVTVKTPNGTSPAVMAVAQTVQPAFFQWGSYTVATHQDYSLAVKNGTLSGLMTVPAAPGDVIILWGTGFGPTNPAAPSGMEVPGGTTYNTASKVTVTVGNAPATVYGAALAPGFAALYQVAIQIPTTLADGDYPIVATVSGTQSPASTLITVQQ